MFSKRVLYFISITGLGLICLVSHAGTNVDFERSLSPLHSLNKTLDYKDGCHLKSISCDIALKQCSIIGYSVESISYTFPQSFWSVDDGENWTPSTMSTEEKKISYFYSVFCDSNYERHCVALGTHQQEDYTPAKAASYISENGGKDWILSSILLSIANTFMNDFTHIACDMSGTRCVAVGYSFDPSIPIHPISVTSQDGGKTWFPSETLPKPQTNSSSELSGIACSKDGINCIAVGHYHTSAGTNPYILKSEDGGKNWRIVTSISLPKNSGSVALVSVACDTSVQFCTAVGYYQNGNYPLFTTDGGNTWEVSKSPLQVKDPGSLEGVACDHLGKHCVAVGETYNVKSSQHLQPLSYISDDGGQHWSLSKMTTSQNADRMLIGISCSYYGIRCIAIGNDWTPAKTLPFTFLTLDGGKSWTFKSIPLPN